MGALIGYLICIKIESSGLKLPVKLIVSERKASRLFKSNVLSNLPDKEFWDEVSKLGGIPEATKNHPELIEYFTPILKADFLCIEKYKYVENSSKITIPIDVFYGSDENITQKEAEA
jgi:external thioesterase TEII